MEGEFLLSGEDSPNKPSIELTTMSPTIAIKIPFIPTCIKSESFCVIASILGEMCALATLLNPSKGHEIINLKSTSSTRYIKKSNMVLL